MTAVRTRARKQPAEVRRETVLDAAMVVFARSPYRAAGTAEIAREAGIAEPTIYRHFSSKRELYLAAVQRTCEMVEDAWRTIVAESPNGVAALNAIGNWYDMSVSANTVPVRLRTRAMAEADDAEIAEVLRTGYKRIHAMVKEQIVRGQAEGLIAATVDADAAAWVYIGMGKILDMAAMNSLEADVFSDCGASMGTFFTRALGVPPEMIDEWVAAWTSRAG